MFDHLEEMRNPSLPASGWTWEADVSVPRARNICFVSHTTFVLLRFDVGKVRYDRNVPIAREYSPQFELRLPNHSR